MSISIVMIEQSINDLSAMVSLAHGNTTDAIAYYFTTAPLDALQRLDNGEATNEDSLVHHYIIARFLYFSTTSGLRRSNN